MHHYGKVLSDNFTGDFLKEIFLPINEQEYNINNCLKRQTI